MLPIPEITIESRRLIAAFVPAFVVAYFILTLDEGTEFPGGWLTGPILRIHSIGTHALLLALVVSAWMPQVASWIGLFGATLCLPMYVWDLAPGVYSWAFPGNYPLAALPFLSFDPFGIAGALTLTVAVWRAFGVAYAHKLLWLSKVT